MLNLLFLISSLYAFDTDQIQQAFYSTVLIQMPNKNHCTGVLVNENHVLTAAHCVDGKGYFEDATVHLHILDKAKSNKVFLTDPIQKIKLHPEYKTGYYKADLVVLKLKSPIPQKLNQARIQLDLNAPTDDYNPSALLMGYGITAQAKVDTELFHEELKYPKIRGKQFNLKSKVDEDYQFVLDNRKAQACIGDSGGPLFATTRNGEHIRLLGLAIAVKMSWLKAKFERFLLLNDLREPNQVQNCTSRIVFLKVSYFKDWIQEAIR